MHLTVEYALNGSFYIKIQEEKMIEEEMTKMVSEFSKGLTLWGSNRVVKNG